MKNVMNQALIAMVMLTLCSVTLAANRIGDRPTVIRLADALTDKTSDFCKLACEIAPLKHFSDRAHHLKMGAENLSRRVGAGVSDQQVLADFYKLNDSFRAMIKEFERDYRRNHDWQVRFFWYRVVFGYEKLRWEILEGTDMLPGEHEGGGPGRGGSHH